MTPTSRTTSSRNLLNWVSSYCVILVCMSKWLRGRATPEFIYACVWGKRLPTVPKSLWQTVVKDGVKLEVAVMLLMVLWSQLSRHEHMLWMGFTARQGRLPPQYLSWSIPDVIFKVLSMVFPTHHPIFCPTFGSHYTVCGQLIPGVADFHLVQSSVFCFANLVGKKKKKIWYPFHFRC